MQEILEAPQITVAEKSKLYSDQLDRLLLLTRDPRIVQSFKSKCKVVLFISVF